MKYNYFLMYVANKININNDRVKAKPCHDKGYRIYISAEYTVVMEILKKYFSEIKLELRYWYNDNNEVNTNILVSYDEEVFTESQEALEKEFHKHMLEATEESLKYSNLIRRVIWLIRYAQYNQKLIVFEPRNGRSKDMIPDVSNPFFVEEILGKV